MSDMIIIDNVKKEFKGDEILHGISHCFEKGQIHGLVGNNGSGKTVLLKCICGFLHPTSGEIKVNGKIIGKDVDFPADTGIIIETPGFLPGLSGFKNLKILASFHDILTDPEIREVMRKVGLDPDTRKAVNKYSLGMRQRLGIAQAIMEHPKLLILDEPFNGLDKNGVAHMRSLIKELKKDDITIILSSHNQADIDELCDTVCEMDAGVLKIIKQNIKITTDMETMK